MASRIDGGGGARFCYVKGRIACATVEYNNATIVTTPKPVDSKGHFRLSYRARLVLFLLACTRGGHQSWCHGESRKGLLCIQGRQAIAPGVFGGVNQN